MAEKKNTTKPASKSGGGGAKKKTPPLGTGARFQAVGESARKGGASDPKAVAAAVGKAKYGKQRMAKLAAAGKKSSAKKKS